MCVVFSPCQTGDGWAAEATGDWGAEESWESVDGNQGASLCWPNQKYEHISVTSIDPFYFSVQKP